LTKLCSPGFMKAQTLFTRVDNSQQFKGARVEGYLTECVETNPQLF